MAERRQDLFISHASEDKSRYVEPLANAFHRKRITYWMDSVEIRWGDSFPLLINEGLRKSRYVLVCLSSNFLKRPWPEAELASALAIQNATGEKRLLPLILNSKALVLETYPLLAPIVYKEYVDPPEQLADEIAKMIKPQRKAKEDLHIMVESVHTGKLCNIYVSPRVSLKWLSDQAQKGLGVSDHAVVTGVFETFPVKWVLVDTRVESAWKKLPRSRKQNTWAVLHTPKGPKYCEESSARLEDLKVTNGAVFHLYGIVDDEVSPVAAFSQPPGDHI
jgi:TIR domain-containing protein